MLSEIALADRWGPFAHGLDPVERIARLRSLRTGLRILCGDRAGLTCAFLALAEDEANENDGGAWMAAAVASFNRLPSRDQRNAVASFGCALPVLERLGFFVSEV